MPHHSPLSYLIVGTSLMDKQRNQGTPDQHTQMHSSRYLQSSSLASAPVQPQTLGNIQPSHYTQYSEYSMDNSEHAAYTYSLTENDAENENSQVHDVGQSIPARNGQSYGTNLAETILRGFGFDERRIDSALDTSTRGIAPAMERFMADNNDGNLFTLSLESNSFDYLDQLGLCETSPPSKQRHEGNRNRHPAQKPEYSDAGNIPKQRLEDQRRLHHKQGVTKERAPRTRGARREPLALIGQFNPS